MDVLPTKLKMYETRIRELEDENRNFEKVSAELHDINDGLQRRVYTMHSTISDLRMDVISYRVYIGAMALSLLIAILI